MKLHRFFNPKSIAVIGTHFEEGTYCHRIITHLTDGAFDGDIYPVCQTEEEVCGRAAYKTIADLPPKTDMLIADLEARQMPRIIAACAAVGIRGVMVLSGGFRLDDQHGDRYYEETIQAARAHRVRLLGANTFGFLRPALHLNASLYGGKVLKGNIAFLSQSRAICTTILNWAANENIGFSAFVSVGSMMDVGFEDLIDFFNTDSQTRSILIYMESLQQARAFMSAARAFARIKPIIVLKAGQTLQGADIIQQRTGFAAGSDAVFQAVFNRSGIIKVDTIEQLFDCVQALATQPRPRGNRLAIVTNAGAPAVLATDFLVKNGGRLAQLSADTRLQLDGILPNNRFNQNPVDVLSIGTTEAFAEAVRLCLKDDQTDGVLVILTAQTTCDLQATARAVAAINRSTHKTLLTALVGESKEHPAAPILLSAGVPVYTFPESAVYSFVKMYNYSRKMELLYETPAAVPDAFTPRRAEAEALITSVLAESRVQMTEKEAKTFVEHYDIPTIESVLVQTETEAVAAANGIGYPVVLKIDSPDITEKSRMGAVRLHIENDQDLVVAFQKIQRAVLQHAPHARISGFAVEPMMSKRYELVIEAEKDPVLGPVISFGMGGIATDLYRDLNYGLPPLNMALALRLIEDTKIYQLLKGYGGVPAVDVAGLQFLLYKFSYLLVDFPQIQRISLNPFMVDEKGGIVLDAEVRLDPHASPLSHLHHFPHLAIAPVPSHLTKTIYARSGKPALLRPIKPEDEPLEAEMIGKFSKRTMHFRYFSTGFSVNHEFLIRFTNMDYDREIAIGAEMDDHDGRRVLVGVVRIVADAQKESAEYAIAIADPWQKEGLGGQMTDFILDIARKMGIRRVTAVLLKSNAGMKRIFEKKGFRVESEDYETYYAELDLTTGN